MASLYIDFGYDDNVKRSINSAKRAINSRISDYNGIINSVNNTSSETSNLWNANTYIKRKRDKLQSKWDKLDRFHGKIDSFNEYASDKDKAVADRIKEETNDFYKRENIKTGFLYTVGCVVSDGWKWIKGATETVWDAVCTGAKAVWKTIKEFYENNKYWIDLVVDLVVVVVAAAAALLASGGILAAVFAAWGLATAVTDLVFDGVAFKAYYADGDEKLAEELSDKGMKDVLETSMGDVGVAIYYGMEIGSAAFDIYDFGKNALESVGKVKTKIKTADRVASYATADKIKGIKSRAIKQGIKEITFDAIGIKDWDNKGHFAITQNKKILSKKTTFTLFDGFDIPTGIISNIKFGVKTTHRVISSDKLTGEKILKTFSISNTGYSFVENIIDAKDSWFGFASA